MEICKDCMKQDVCKYKKGIEKFEEGKHRFGLPEPLTLKIDCPYKMLGGSL